MEAGHDVNAPALPYGGFTSLHLAARRGHHDIANHLLDQGADINATNWLGECALHEAVKYGGTPIIQLLLERGANTEIANHEGFTPRQFAESNYLGEEYALAARGALGRKAQGARPTVTLAAPDEYMARRGRGRCM